MLSEDVARQFSDEISTGQIHLKAVHSLSKLKDDVENFVLSRNNEGKKPSKNAAEESVVNDNVINDSFCSSIPPDLARKCLSVMIALQPLCIRRGYVLDSWNGVVVNDYESTFDAINLQKRVPRESTDDQSGQENMRDTSESFSDEHTIKEKFLDFVVEFQV